jgi:hypothetical protein
LTQRAQGFAKGAEERLHVFMNFITCRAASPNAAAAKCRGKAEASAKAMITTEATEAHGGRGHWPR